MSNILAIVIIILMILAAIYLYRFLFIRGMRKVVAIFREHRALDAKRAKTLDELGLQRPPYVKRMFRPRDYKQSAAELLFRHGIIQATEAGKFYLSETALGQSNFNKYIDQD